VQHQLLWNVITWTWI